MRNYSVLRADSEVFAVQINPAAYNFSAFVGGRPSKDKVVVAFNVNYNWLGMPIGYLRANGNDVSSIPAYLDLRPVLVYDSYDKRWAIISGKSYTREKLRFTFAFQAGPTLVEDGVVKVQSKTQKFRDDAVRRTAQPAIGVTPSGKLIIAYSFNWSMDQLAAFMKSAGCYRAMKADGGSASFITFSPDLDHRGVKSYTYGNKGKIAVGIQFLRK